MINNMKKKITLILCLIIAMPMLQSCGSTRGCKKMRKYRKYSQTIIIDTNQANIFKIN